MANVSDVLRELEDIGALGNSTVPQPVRRAVVHRELVPPPRPAPVVEDSVKDISAEKSEVLLSGFREQLDQLCVSLQSMLEWCNEARSCLDSDESETDDEESGDSEDPVEEDSSEGDGSEDEQDGDEGAESEPATELSMESKDPEKEEPVVAPEAPKPESDSATRSVDLTALKAKFLAPDALSLSRDARSGNGSVDISKAVVDRINQINKEEDGTNG